MISPGRLLHRQLRSLGLQVQRWRDPYRDAAGLLVRKEVTHVVDGGAYHGTATRRLMSLFPSATIHGFEPQSESFQFLQLSLGNEPRVRLEPCALSDHTGKATLHVNRNAPTTSLLPTMDAESMQPLENRLIECVTLDGWAKARSIADVGLLKLDLQGHELAALKGAQHLLSSSIEAVVSEVNFKQRYAGTCLFHEIADFLWKMDFRLHRLYEIIPARDGGWRQADALFVRAPAAEPKVSNGKWQ